MSICPYPAVETTLEAIYQSERNDEQGNTPADIPEVALITQYGGRVLDVHPKIRREE